MNEEIKRLWLARLRSGEDKQGCGALHVIYRDGKEKFCCLGVLCKLAAGAGVTEHSMNSEGGHVFYGRSSEAAVLSAEVMAWAGLSSNNPGVECPYGDVTLTELNDGWINNTPLSFPEIADIIEERL